MDLLMRPPCLFPASLLSSALPSFHCGCQDPNITASSWVSASEARQALPLSALQRYLILTRPKRSSSSNALASSEEGNGTKKKNKEMERIAESWFDGGEEGWSVIEIWIWRDRWWKTRNECRIGVSSHVNLFEYIKAPGRKNDGLDWEAEITVNHTIFRSTLLHNEFKYR